MITGYKTPSKLPTPLWKVHVECDLSKVKRSKRAIERLGDHLSRAQFIELTHHGDML